MFRVDPVSGRWASQSEQLPVPPFRLLSVGDFCPATGRTLDEVVQSGPAAIEKMYDNVLNVLCEKDLSIVNFEGPIAPGGEAIVKDGPNLIFPPEAIEAARFGQFDVMNLANNHVLDYGPETLIQTIASAREAGFEVVGAGGSLSAARRSLVLEVNGLRVGLMAVAENEYASARGNRAGANPLDPAGNVLSISELKGRCDLVFVCVHGGSELCPLPSPRMVKLYRSFVQAGADAVIGCHAHTVMPIEFYESRPIIYNLGNFLFASGSPTPDPMWTKAMGVRLEFRAGRLAHLQVIPWTMAKDGRSVNLLDEQARRDFLTRLNRLGEILAEPQRYQAIWDAYCLGRMAFYQARLSEASAGLGDPSLRAKAANHLANLLRCEAHHDVITRGLELIAEDAQPDSDAKNELDTLMETLEREGE